MPLLNRKTRPQHSLSRRSAEIVAVLLICVVALSAAAYISTTVFDRLPHTEDEFAYLFQARTLASGAIVAPAPRLPDFFFMPFIILRDGMWFGKYTPGFPAVLALGTLTSQPWLVNPVFGALSVCLLHLAGRRLYGARTGFLAAALAVVSPFFLLQAGSFLSHVVSLFWVLSFMILFEKTRNGAPWGAGLGAGAAIGMLLISRPLTAVGIAIPYALWSAIAILHRRDRISRYVPAVLGALPFLVALLAYNNLTTGSMFRMGYELWWPTDRIGFGPDVGVQGGHGLSDGLENLKLNLDAMSVYLFGWPWRLSLVPAVLAALLAFVRLGQEAVLRRHGRRQGLGSATGLRRNGGTDTPPEAWDLLHAAVIISLVAVYLAYWSHGQMYGPRYYFEALGAIILLSARGLTQIVVIASLALRKLMSAGPGAIRWATLAALLPVAGLTTTGYTDFVPHEFSKFVRWYNIDGSGIRVVGTAQPRNAVVFIAAPSWQQYASFFSLNAPTLDGDVVYAMDLGPGPNQELMALYPGRTAFRYSEGRLEPIDRP